MIPESISVVYNDHIPVAPRPGQAGLRIVATSTASAPVALPGELGDILSIAVLGAYPVQFKLCKTTGSSRANNADTVVWAKKDLLFLVPSPTEMGLASPICYISVISPDGDSVVVINTYKRGT